MFFYGFVSYVLFMPHDYKPSFSLLLVSLTDPSTPSSPSPVPSTSLSHTTIALPSSRFPPSSHSVILSLLPIQKEAQSLHGSADEGVVTHHQTKKAESRALFFPQCVEIRHHSKLDDTDQQIQELLDNNQQSDDIIFF